MKHLPRSTFSAAATFLTMAVWMTACGGEITESGAKRIALDRFMQVCATTARSAADYDGPISARVGGVPFAFEWTRVPRDSGDGILITVDQSGGTNVSFVPRWASRAASPESEPKASGR